MQTINNKWFIYSLSGKGEETLSKAEFTNRKLGKNSNEDWELGISLREFSFVDFLEESSIPSIIPTKDEEARIRAAGTERMVKWIFDKFDKLASNC